jgi:hypothetical protein
VGREEWRVTGEKGGRCEDVGYVLFGMCVNCKLVSLGFPFSEGWLPVPSPSLSLAGVST